MNDWMPCLYAAALIALGAVAAWAWGFWAGRVYEQRALSELLRPEKWSTPAH